MQEAPQDFLQEEIANWATKLLKLQQKKIKWLAKEMGMEPSALSRSLNGQRAFKLQEVAKMALSLQKVPPIGNIIRRLAAGRNLLPLMGRINAAVWSVKSGVTSMAIGIAPIECIETGCAGDAEQVTYAIESGAHAGHYAVCQPVENADLDETSVYVVEEGVTVQQTAPLDLFRLTLRKPRKAGGAFELVGWDQKEDLEPIALPSERVRIEAKVRWILVPVGDAALTW